MLRQVGWKLLGVSETMNLDPQASEWRALLSQIMEPALSRTTLQQSSASVAILQQRPRTVTIQGHVYGGLWFFAATTSETHETDGTGRPKGTEQDTDTIGRNWPFKLSLPGPKLKISPQVAHIAASECSCVCDKCVVNRRAADLPQRMSPCGLHGFWRRQ